MKCTENRELYDIKDGVESFVILFFFCLLLQQKNNMDFIVGYYIATVW